MPLFLMWPTTKSYNISTEKKFWTPEIPMRKKNTNKIPRRKKLKTDKIPVTKKTHKKKLCILVIPTTKNSGPP